MMHITLTKSEAQAITKTPFGLLSKEAQEVLKIHGKTIQKWCSSADIKVMRARRASDGWDEVGESDKVFAFFTNGQYKLYKDVD